MRALTEKTSRMEKLLSAQKGVVIERYGERLYFERCKPIDKYWAIWSRKVTSENVSRCYEDLPLKIAGEVRFLDLSTRTVHDLGRARDCEKKGRTLYLRDRNQNWWELKGGDTHALPAEPRPTEAEIKIPPLAPFNASASHYDDLSAPIEPVLRNLVESQILAREGTVGEESIEDVGGNLEHDYKELGKWADTNLWGRYIKHVKMVVGIVGAIIALLIVIKIACCLRKRRSQESNQGPNVTVVSMGSESNEGRKLAGFPGIGTAVKASGLGWRKERTAQV
jgi:hypothetical protein